MKPSSIIRLVLGLLIVAGSLTFPAFIPKDQRVNPGLGIIFPNKVNTFAEVGGSPTALQIFDDGNQLVVDYKGVLAGYPLNDGVAMRTVYLYKDGHGHLELQIDKDLTLSVYNYTSATLTFDRNQFTDKVPWPPAEEH